jgi:hypothetical protein
VDEVDSVQCYVNEELCDLIIEATAEYGSWLHVVLAYIFLHILQSLNHTPMDLLASMLPSVV